MARLDWAAMEAGDYEFRLHLIDGGELNVGYCPWRRQYSVIRYDRRYRAPQGQGWVGQDGETGVFAHTSYHHDRFGAIAALVAVNDLIPGSDQWIAEYPVPF